MSGDISIAVPTGEAAEQLKQDFEELLVRVNSDMMFQSMKPDDPVSVEAAIAAAERSIDFHLAEFREDLALQSLRADLKVRYRAAIQQQAHAAANA